MIPERHRVSTSIRYLRNIARNPGAIELARSYDVGKSTISRLA
jgi:hypothetical protein